MALFSYGVGVGADCKGAWVVHHALRRRRPKTVRECAANDLQIAGARRRARDWRTENIFGPHRGLDRLERAEHFTARLVER